MTTEITLQIVLDYQSSGPVKGRFVNASKKRLVLRHLFFEQEIKCVNESGNISAFPILSSSFGEIIDKFILEEGAEERFEIDIHRDFFFPVAGRYRIWVEYDTSRQTSPFDTEYCDVLKATSNEVVVFVNRPSKRNV